MAKAKKKLPFQILKKNLLPIILSVLLFILIIITYLITISDKYYPLTFVGDTNISFLTEGQAIKLVQANFQKRARQKLSFTLSTGSASAFTIDLATSSAALDYTALDKNFQINHNVSFWHQAQAQLQTLFAPAEIDPEITLSLERQLDTIASAVNQEPQNAELIFNETPESPDSTPSASIKIKEGVDGRSLDKNTAEKLIKEFLLTGKCSPLLPLKSTPPKITTDQVNQAKEALEAVIKVPIKLTFADKTFVLDAKQLLTLLDLTKGENSLLDRDQTYIYLKSIAQEIDQNVQEGLFEFDPTTKRVSAFRPSSEGRKLDINKTVDLLNDALTGSSTKTITLPVEVVKPKIETSDVNKLGIKELLGRGVSNFAGSIDNRIYNVRLTASKINGVLIAPGDTFSFNQTVGDISAATGFKQAYVIKEGRTVLDDGGGVCQDSTTLFRAVLNAGLPVIQRTAHAYRVGYYEQGFPPGLDATVFYPSVDFQFKNDTANHILIQAYTVGTTLYFDLYGTSDGRTVSLTRPVITNQTPPPPELRQDDPTLPKGTVKQVDWSAWGATVTFKRTVTKNGQVIANETWKSAYKPWQAVFLVGTKE